MAFFVKLLLYSASQIQELRNGSTGQANIAHQDCESNAHLASLTHSRFRQRLLAKSREYPWCSVASPRDTSFRVC